MTTTSRDRLTQIAYRFPTDVAAEREAFRTLLDLPAVARRVDTVDASDAPRDVTALVDMRCGTAKSRS